MGNADTRQQSIDWHTLKTFEEGEELELTHI